MHALIGHLNETLRVRKKVESVNQERDSLKTDLSELILHSFELVEAQSPP